MKIIDDKLLREEFNRQGVVEAYRNARSGIGARVMERNFAADFLNLPRSLCFAIEQVLTEDPQAKNSVLDSISCFSLFYGLFLPLSGMTSEKIAQLFHLPWRQQERDSISATIEKFLHKDLGLNLREKILFLSGDPFSGESSFIGEETLLQVLASIRMVAPRKLRERLTQVVDIGLLFAEEVNLVKSDPALTAREVLYTLRGLPDVRPTVKKEVLRDLFMRAGRLERYFIARLILRRLNFGYEYRSNLIHAALAKMYGTSAEEVANGVALSDVFTVTDILEKQGATGLARLVLKPLSPVSPALAAVGEIGKKTSFPLWVECKYDGIRLLLHKETSVYGSRKYAAFTRRKNNWLDLVPGLENSLQWISAHSFIFDCELSGKIRDFEREMVRPATVYEVYKHLQSGSEKPIQIQCVIFDILYLDGSDVTQVPFLQRRQLLERVIAPMSGYQTPVPFVISEGWTAKDLNEFNKWYRHFNGQGYEGVMAKTLQHTYPMGRRSPDWLKKKPEIHLDLVVTGAYWATAERGPQGFGAYEISCRTETGLHPLGRAAGLALEQNMEIIHRIGVEGLFTGHTFESRTSRGIRQGMRLSPSIVATVRFEGITKDKDGIYSLRDPKIVYIRPRGDITLNEVDSYADVAKLYLKTRLR